MSKESQARINRYAQLIEDGKWQQSIREMIADDVDYAGIKNFFYSINFYPDAETLEYAQDCLAHKTNKEALDSFFAKNI